MKRLKNRIRVISLLIACSLILGCTVSATNSNAPLSAEELAALPEDIRYELLNDQSEATAAYESLFHYLGIDTLDFDGVWPEEYAGCYINDNNKLIVCLTEITPELQEKYINICKANIGFQLAKYSQQDIAAMCTVLEGYDRIDKIIVRYSNKNNQLVIEVDSPEEQELLERYITKHTTYAVSKNASTEKGVCSIFSDIIRYNVKNPGEHEYTNSPSSTSAVTQGQVTTTTTIKIGSRIFNRKQQSMSGTIESESFTLGIWATKNINGADVIGFVTCAHPFYSNGTGMLDDDTAMDVYINNGEDDVIIGTIDDTYDDIQLDSEHDCAFVTLTDANYAPTTLVKTGGTLYQLHTGASCEGKTVYISGQNSGLIRGVVAYGGVLGSFRLETGYLINLATNAGFWLRKGDSGGPAYFVDATTNTRKLFGFQSAGQEDATVPGDIIGDEIYSKAEVSRADFAFEELGVTIYTGS